jgi:hypothetical protein
MKHLKLFEEFPYLIMENLEEFNKISTHFEQEINHLHKGNRFKDESNTYGAYFNEIGKYLQKNNLLQRFDTKLKELIVLSNKLKSLNKVDEQFNSILKQILLKKEELKKEILSNNNSNNITNSTDNKEMSKKYPKITISDVKIIKNEFDRLLNKYNDNQLLNDLYNKWLSGENKDGDYDFWENEMIKIFSHKKSDK